MNLFRKKKEFVSRIRNYGKEEELITCRKCGKESTRKSLKSNMYVCPYCGYHMPVTAAYRIRSTADEGSFREICGSLIGKNPLDYPDYEEKLRKTRESTGMKEGVITGTCSVDGLKTVVCAMDGRFLMGSMGAAVGEKITRAFEYAASKKLPVIVYSVSGGARMQEGLVSLFQMAKTAAAVRKHSRAGCLYVCVLTDPTTGGVEASFAGMGDITIAEPGALVGFAGPRVIRQTIGEELPEDFQRAEKVLETGFADMICDRREMRKMLADILKLHSRNRRRHEK